MALPMVLLETAGVEPAAVIGDAKQYTAGVALHRERHAPSPGVLGGIAHQLLSHPVDEVADARTAVELAHRDLDIHTTVGERGQQLAEGPGQAIAGDVAAGEGTHQRAQLGGHRVQVVGHPVQADRHRGQPLR